MEEHPTLLADGFSGAFIGYGYQFNNRVAVYDYDECIKILMRDMSYEEAIEYMDFNVTGAYVGPTTPVFLVCDEK